MDDHTNPSEIAVKSFTITVETPDGAMPPARVQVPDIPTGLADLVLPVYELCNGATALAIRRSESLGKKVACGRDAACAAGSLFLCQFLRRSSWRSM